MGMLPELEKQYPEGSDLTIMNTFYQYPKFEDGKKVEDDYIALVYKDNVTGKKKYKIIKKPEYTFYILKNEADRVNYNRMFIERDKVTPVTVPYLEVEKEIAKLTGNEEFYATNIKNRNKPLNNQLHTNPDIFYSDANIEDHYRFKFANTYENEIKKIKKGFFDIEVDGKWAAGDFVLPGECAINCVSFYNEGTDTVYTYILRDERNPLIEKFENEFKSGSFIYDEIRNFVIEAVGGMKQAKKYNLMNTKFQVNFYDDELYMIKDLFRNIHFCSPDFIEGWNSSGFDLPYIIQRIINLGGNPEEIMCDECWPIKAVKHYVDQKHLNELAERGDYTFISGLPVFLDQMIQYASRRKSKIGSYKSFKLDDIGLKEAKVRKLDYHHITNSVLELPWLDFKTFVLYNIMDVIVQKCIETKTNDLEYIFSKCVVNNTVYQKGHRQTVYLINRMCAEWYKMGYIIGNNCNRDNPKPPKYLGALVGDPLNTNDFSKMTINDRAIWICENLIDYDFKALYPSIMGEDNIAPNTQIGRIEIPDKVYENENAYHIEESKYSRGGEFIENLVSDDTIEYCHRWFHLANTKEFIDDLNEFYSGFGSNDIKFTNLISAGYGDGNKRCPLKPTTKSSVRQPIYFGTKTKTFSPVIFYNERNKDITYEKLISEKG